MINGFDKLTQELKELQQFSSDIDGSLGTLKFDASNAESIEQAIIQMENLVDNKAIPYASNDTIMEAVAGIKEQFRQMIIDKSSETRLKADNQEC